MQKQTNKNLLVCLTPLQMLIASKIVEHNPASYDTLCLSYNENEKYNHYLEKLSHKCNKSYRFLVYSQNKIYRIFDFFRFKAFLFKFLASDEYNNIYCASIDNPFVHLLLSIVTKKNIITFDDGSANIYKDSIYYNHLKKNKLQKITLKLLGNKYSLAQILAESKMHYTIYDCMDNITKNTIFLPLFLKEKDSFCKKKIKIFLGQPLNELQGINIKNIFSFLSEKSVTNYFPHPREVIKYQDFKYINTPLIFEDYILTLLNKGYWVEIYTILSTAALNTSSLKNISIYVLREKGLNMHYNAFYEIFLNRKNCNIYEL